MSDWMNRTAPPLGKVYPAWRNDPNTGEQPRSYAGWLYGPIVVGAALILLAWWLS